TRNWNEAKALTRLGLLSPANPRVRRRDRAADQRTGRESTNSMLQECDPSTRQRASTLRVHQSPSTSKKPEPERSQPLSGRYRLRASLAVATIRIARRSTVVLCRRMPYQSETSSGLALPTAQGAKQRPHTSTPWIPSFT